MSCEALFLAGSGSLSSRVHFAWVAARMSSFPFDRSCYLGGWGERPTGVQAEVERRAVLVDEVTVAVEMVVWSVARAGFTVDRCIAAPRARISASRHSTKLSGVSVEAK